MTRLLTLVERRRKLVRLPPEVVSELRRHFGQVIEVTPSHEPGHFHLTARGYVGQFAAGGVAFTIEPKYPVHFFAGQDGTTVRQTSGEFIQVAGASFARQLVAELAAWRRSGLLRDYVETATQSATVRGRIDFAAQARHPRDATTFHLVGDEFTPDHVWNRIPRAAARRLLASELPLEVRAALQLAAAPFDAVSDWVPDDEVWGRLVYEGRTATYRPLMELCRTILSGFGGGHSASTRLLNLETIFERELLACYRSPGMLPRGWTVNAQEGVALDSPARRRWMRPDYVLRDDRGEVAGVWDAKWKTLRAAGPEDDDLQQVLAYAAALGARRVGLWYPGRRCRAEQFSAPSGVVVSVVALPVTGGRPRFERAFRRVVRGQTRR